MKRILILTFLIANVFASFLNAQTWDYENRKIVSTGDKLFRSTIVNPVDFEEITNNMPHFHLDSLFKANADLTGGIKGLLSGFGAEVVLEIHAYNTNGTTGQMGGLLYRIEAASLNENTFSGVPDPLAPLTNNVKYASQHADLFVLKTGAPCDQYYQNWIKSYFRYKGGGYNAETSQCNEYIEPNHPVVITLTTRGNATISKIKLPIIGELDPVTLFSKANIQNTELLVQNPSIKESALDLKLNFTLKNDRAASVNVTDVSFEVRQNDTQQTIVGTAITEPNFTLGASATKTFTDKVLLNSSIYGGLGAGSYSVVMNYKVPNPQNTAEFVKLQQHITFFRKTSTTQLTEYQITKTTYHSLPVYKLRGGMSAEYTVQKSLAALDGGISHTWDIRKKPDGNLDLSGGGPVSVYSTPDFLDKSVKQTVKLYNDNLGATTNFNTVIISTGVPSVPYFSYYLGAPVLPLHFLVAGNSIGEIQTIVDHANSNGYSCYSTAGYDPSIIGEGVAWIKLLDLPPAYKTFLENHNVQNVIILGADESGYGEVIAQRVLTKNTPNAEYGPGSIYIMTHGGEEGLNNLKSYYVDYESYAKEEKKAISDWESGLTNTQLVNFRNSIRAITTNPPEVYSIVASESIGFYNIAMDLTLKFWEKNSTTLGSNPTNGIVMNEYLIGYPGYEAKKGDMPMLYWQIGPKNTSARMKNLLKYKLTKQYSSLNFNATPVKFNAKYDRNPFINALKDIGMINVTQNSWQKADVWNPLDGMNAPCELAANDIKNNLGGAAAYKTWVTGLTKLTISDLEGMAKLTKDNTGVPTTHPSPNASINVKSIAEAGLDIKRYEFSPSAYWNSREFLKEVKLTDMTTSTTGELKGWIDGISKEGNERKQRITIAQFDLTNTSDEYDLKIGYKFHPKPGDGFKTYNSTLGDQQEMDCFEYTKVPKTSWLNIPSRVMAREGAIMALNGSVYDWDYNGIPGVVPFIKVNNVVKAQPQILSYKGEAMFAWNWGSNKSVTLTSRPKEVAASGIVESLKTLFHTETSSYSNALAGMTFMSGGNTYDPESIQPTWMVNSAPTNPKYLGPSGTNIRCFLSNPLSTCVHILENTWGTFETASKEEGWNDCSRLFEDEAVQRFSTVAYRQYNKLFERVPNGRTYVAKKGNKLDIGIIDGDLGNFGDARGVNYSKTYGMKNSEVSKFYQYKQYDQLMNLDGGSSSQLWLNGRGPLHDWTGYPLKEDNQGPYYSRLVSSYVLLVPKLHTDQVKKYSTSNNNYMILDNSNLSFDYNEVTDHGADKAFISLSPSLDKLVDNKFYDGNYGMIAGNFNVNNVSAAEGAILFSITEDSYYPDTEGQSLVIPEFRNALVVGVGKIPNPLLDSLKTKKTGFPSKTTEYQQLMAQNTQGIYYIKLYGGEVIEYFFEDQAPNSKYMTNSWKSFMVRRYRDGFFNVKFEVLAENQILSGKSYSRGIVSPGKSYNMFNFQEASHAMIGGVNVDGRFVTGNAKLEVDNYMFITSAQAMSNFNKTDLNNISIELESNHKLPSNLGNKFYNSGVYALQFEESSGQHSFSLAPTSGTVRLYGLNLNTSRSSESSSAKSSKEKALDVVEQAESKIETLVFPNPARGEVSVYFNLPIEGQVHVNVYDIQGKLIISSRNYSDAGFFDKKDEYEAGNHEIRLHGLNRAGIQGGIYSIEIQGQGMKIAKKVIFE